MPSRLSRNPLPQTLTAALTRPRLAVLVAGFLLAWAAPAGAHVSLHLRSLGRVASGTGSQMLPARASSSASAAAEAQPLDPGQIRRAYALPATGARGQKIAIVSAFDDPSAESDLAAYDKQWGLRACTTANKCFEKLNEEGKATPLPSKDLTGGTWITESALGTEVAHGICQGCSIMLVEASSTGRTDFSKAVAAAAKAGATVIVTTFFDIEQNVDPTYANDYLSKHAIVVAAVGDAVGQYGYSGEGYFPSTLPDVLAVGGTTLKTGSNGAYRSEQVWNGTISGCSLYQPAPSWQSTIAASVGCQARRAVADVAAMADPGAAVHITGTSAPGGPWYAASGTSLSAPIVAATIGLAGSVGSREPSMLYSRAKSDPGAFHDVRTGANSPTCSSAICRAGRGYDGPTGVGTPYGLAAFLPSGGALDRRHPGVSITAPRRTLRPSRSWKLTLTLRNRNPFTVTGSVALQRGRGRSSVFASKAYRLAPLATGKVTLTVKRSSQRLLRQLHLTSLFAHLSARGPVKPTVRRAIAYGFRLP